VKVTIEQRCKKMRCINYSIPEKRARRRSGVNRTCRGSTTGNIRTHSLIQLEHKGSLCGTRGSQQAV
jgi:hypothetical protein